MIISVLVLLYINLFNKYFGNHGIMVFTYVFMILRALTLNFILIKF
jgi:hypothetical protein